MKFTSLAIGLLYIIGVLCQLTVSAPSAQFEPKSFCSKLPSPEAKQRCYVSILEFDCKRNKFELLGVFFFEIISGCRTNSFCATNRSRLSINWTVETINKDHRILIVVEHGETKPKVEITRNRFQIRFIIIKWTCFANHSPEEIIHPNIVSESSHSLVALYTLRKFE